MNDLEEIRSRISIEELVGQYVQLKKSGRNFKARCPFHQEKTPSFIVSPDKGLAYCFGCRKGGDIFAFFQEIENVEFPEAVRMLAEKAGVEVKTSFSSQNKDQKDKILQLIQVAQQFFQQQLAGTKEPQAYLEQRGYDKTLREKYGLGFAPDSFHELTNFLKGKGYSSKDILDAGLASQKNVGDENIFDRFRQRVMFPIHNPQGRLVAFGGRTLAKDTDSAKYLNSPETSYYHKRGSLYCFHLAKQAIREKDQAIVVEGYFDALSCHQLGYPQTVASLGTALTEGQIKLISRFTKRILFAFDADQSGQTAASRSIEVAQRLGCSVSVILIPSGKDPDECLRTSPEEWKKAVEEAVPAMDYEFQKAFAESDSASLEGKKAISRHLLPIIKRFPNAIEQEHYLKKLSLELGVSGKSLLVEFQKVSGPSAAVVASEGDENDEPVISSEAYTKLDLLLGLLMQSPDLAEMAQNHLQMEYLESESEKSLYKTWLNHYNLSARQFSENQKKKGSQSTQNDSSNPQKDEEATRLHLLALYAEEKYQVFRDSDRQAEVNTLCQSIRQDYKKRRLQVLRLQMAQPDQADNQELIQEYQSLLADKF